MRSSFRRLSAAGFGATLVLAAGTALAQAPPPLPPGQPGPPVPPPPAAAPQPPPAPRAAPLAAEPLPSWVGTPYVKPGPPITLGLDLHVGGTVKINDGQYFTATERGGLVLGADAFVDVSRQLALGLGYEHALLDGEQGAVPGSNEGVIDVSRALDTVWAMLRAFPFRSETRGIFVELGPGLSWQTVHASIQVPAPYQCSGSDTANFGLRIGAGAEILLTDRLWFVADAAFDNLRLSTDVLGNCVPGAGTASLFGLRTALMYRFDVSRYVR
jgi:hypothetical protein